MIQAPFPPGERLPAAVHELALRLGANPAGGSATVELQQSGRMKQKLETIQWMTFNARQTISTRECAFDWRARFGPLGLIVARDALIDGQGRFDLTAFGVLPLAHVKSTPQLIRGELMRYLAELAWAPDAILHNAALTWREDRADRLVVSAGSADTTAEVVLSLDGEGRIVGAFAPDRPRAVGDLFLPTPWQGRFSDYRKQGGRWIPFAGEVAWVMEGQEQLYWQGRVKQWRQEP